MWSDDVTRRTRRTPRARRSFAVSTAFSEVVRAFPPRAIAVARDAPLDEEVRDLGRLAPRRGGPREPPAARDDERRLPGAEEARGVEDPVGGVDELGAAPRRGSRREGPAQDDDGPGRGGGGRVGRRVLALEREDEGVAHDRERRRDEDREREEAEPGGQTSPAPPRHHERDEAEEDGEVQREDERGRDLRGEEHAR